jgi:CopG family transcriptional regulator, nickel-responsive regulator
MTIISISVDEKVLSEIDSLQKELNFSGRSEIFRTALNNLISELKQKKNLIGKVDAILIISHNDCGYPISKIMHSYSFLIKTQMHNHTILNKCQEIFLLNGDGKKIKQLYEELITIRKIGLVKLIID